MRSGDRVKTGTGPKRRRLTVCEAEAGGLPDRFTAEEWEAMRQAASRRSGTAVSEKGPLKEILTRFLVCADAAPSPSSAWMVDVPAMLQAILTLEWKLQQARKRCATPNHCHSSSGVVR